MEGYTDSHKDESKKYIEWKKADIKEHILVGSIYINF
jgi:hypothetical protein